MKALFDKFRRRDDDDVSPPFGEPQARKKPARGLDIRALVMPLLVTSLATLLVVAALIYVQFTHVVQVQSEAVGQAEADRMAGRLAGRLQGYTDVIAAAGRAPAVVAAMAAGDQAVLEQQAARLHELFPAVLRIRFLALGDDRLDETATPPLSYACLELARLAEAGQVPPVEAHLHGTAGQHMDLLHAVVGPQGVVGSLMVSLDMAGLQEWLRPLLPAAGGYVELRQGGEGKSLLLAAVGDANRRQAAAGYAAAVAGSGWSLQYWSPAPAATLDAAQQSVFLTIFGVALLVLLVAFALYSAAIKRIVHADLVAVAKQAVEMWSGHHQHNFEARLAESLEVLAALEQRLQMMQPKAIQPDAAKAEAMRRSAGLVVDELPGPLHGALQPHDKPAGDDGP